MCDETLKSVYEAILTSYKTFSVFPRSVDIASQLKVSESTLRRRLGNAGTRYQSIVDSIRFEIAKELLQSASYSNCDIAEKLNFSEVGSFFRAFKRWAGVGPSAYKKLQTSGV